MKLASDPFARDYETARSRFLAAGRRYDAACVSYSHPLRGPYDESLSCDALRIGKERSARLLVCISGTHGLEGFAGSAAQVAWLDRGIHPPKDTAVLLIHALNPWGFAHGTRTTENNVDLNRNFIDFRNDPRLETPIYAELHAALCPPAWRREHIDASSRALREAQERHGAAAVLDALNRGQYSHSDGLIFGGCAPEWSNTILHEIISEYSRDVKLALIIDLHTGLGAFAKPTFLPFDPPGSDDRRWVESLFGIDESSPDPFDDNTRPAYRGLVCEAAANALSGARTGRIVIEFGTLPMMQMIRAVQIDRLLRFAKVGRSKADELRRFASTAFNPDDAGWRRAVIAHSENILERAMQGVARRTIAPGSIHAMAATP